MFYLKQHEIVNSFPVFLFSFSRIHYLDESKEIFQLWFNALFLGLYRFRTTSRLQVWFYIQIFKSPSCVAEKHRSSDLDQFSVFLSKRNYCKHIF